MKRNGLRWGLAAVAATAALIIIGGLLHIRLQKSQSVYEFSVNEDALSQQDESEGRYRKIEVNGKVYRYNTGIRNILYMGIDTEDIPEEISSSSKAGQADSIMLLSMDRRTGEMHILAIPRDSMTEIRMYDNTGAYLGKTVQHLSLSYAYGDGSYQSCELVAETVSQLLYDIPVDRYISTDIASIGEINDIVGGVTVTVPGDDLEYLDMGFDKGKKIRLDQETAEIFVRTRDITKNFTNEGRMLRQKEFIQQFIERLCQRMSSDKEGTLQDIEALEQLAVTNLRTPELEEILGNLGKSELSEESYHILDGENIKGDLHDEFQVDMDKLLDLILDIYYVEM